MVKLGGLKRKVVVFLAVIAFLIPYSTHADLIKNGSFETVPNNNTGQGLIPSEWQIISPDPDTWSVDGSYGLRPSEWDNFIPGATAHDGLRWVAGYSVVPEAFGQTLSAPLTPGWTYQLSAYLLQAIRSDLANPGSYQISLSGPSGNSFVLGQFDWISNSSAWENRTLTFVAPLNADFLSFTSISKEIGSAAYPGIDSISLTAIPEPISTVLFLLGGATLAVRRLRRKN